jgi:uncharacterized phage protein (TIGR02216 family)
MAFGLGVLKLTPAAFWTMTLKELAAVVRGTAPAPGARLGKSTLEGLMRRYPDRDAVQQEELS